MYESESIVYTFSLLLSGYSLSYQPQYGYASLLSPILYGPLRKKFLKKFGFLLKDAMAWNTLFGKFFSDSQDELRKILFARR